MAGMRAVSCAAIIDGPKGDVRLTVALANDAADDLAAERDALTAAIDVIAKAEARHG